ncbi:hypothetical protein UK23_38275 [Lentzea aerocolonigenes]|uniref:RING-type domain-containing protein n=1 Tax=Lentzea aerocolonigenes TaxID=68170 RepID=A0A0F0GI59_LENAE|nr:RING-H2 finger protein [Lentzea aerocolonigenes]KJK42186.1 hypothetical protein UK23_38275 [Lentzea aerocolonigenes]
MVHEVDLTQWSEQLTGASRFEPERVALVEAVDRYNGLVRHADFSALHAVELLRTAASTVAELHTRASDLVADCTAAGGALDEWFDELRDKAGRWEHFAAVLDTDVSADDLRLSFDHVFLRWNLPSCTALEGVAALLDAGGRGDAADALGRLDDLRNAPRVAAVALALPAAPDAERMREVLLPFTYQVRDWSEVVQARMAAVEHALLSLHAEAVALRDCASEVYGVVAQVSSQLADAAEPVCTVCQETMSGNGTLTLSCGHVFHNDCVVPWLEQRRTCPLCREVEPGWENVEPQPMPDHIMPVLDLAEDFEGLDGWEGLDGSDEYDTDDETETPSAAQPAEAYVRAQFPPQQRQTLYVAWPDSARGRQAMTAIRQAIDAYGTATGAQRTAAANAVRTAVKARDELLGPLVTRDLSSWLTLLADMPATTQGWADGSRSGEDEADGLLRRMADVQECVRELARLDDGLDFAVPQLTVLNQLVAELADSGTASGRSRFTAKVEQIRELVTVLAATLAPLANYAVRLQDDHDAVIRHLADD